MGVNILPKTVTGQRRPAIFEPRSFCAWVQHESDFLCITPVLYSTGELVQTYWQLIDWSENARLENRKLFKKLFKLLYLRFPPLQIRTCVFRTCIFHPCIFVLTYSVFAYSILRYFVFPYLRFQSPHLYNVENCATGYYSRAACKNDSAVGSPVVGTLIGVILA